MSIPYCLTNPTLRQTRTAWGLVTLERNKNDGSFTIWKDGVNLGAVAKAPSGKKWFVCGTQILRTTKKRRSLNVCGFSSIGPEGIRPDATVPNDKFMSAKW